MSGTTAINRASRLRIFTEAESDLEAVTLRLVPAGVDASRDRFPSGKLRCVSEPEFSSPLRRAIADARLQLTQAQQVDGSFRGQRPVDPRAVVQFLLVAAWPDRHASDNVRTAMRALTDAQRPDGSWPRCHGGAADVSTTMLAYLALKLWDCSARETVLQTARRYLWKQGGLAVADTPTRMYLALFGQLPIRKCRIGRSLGRGTSGTIQRLAFRLLKQQAPQATSGRPGLVRELVRAEATEKDGWRKQAGVGRIGSAVWPFVMRLWRMPRTNPIVRLSKAAGRWRARRLRAGLVRRLRSASGGREGCVGLSADAVLWASLALSCDRPGRIGHRNFGLRRLRRVWADAAADGLWTPLDPAGTADTAMAVVALTRSGLSVRSAAVRAAVKCLVQRPPRSMAESVWTLRALNAALSSDDRDAGQLPPEVQICRNDAQPPAAGDTPAGWLASAHDLQHRLKTRLLESQRPDGGWSAAQPDCRPTRWFAGSQIGLTALVLQALGAAGYRVGSPTVDRAVSFLHRTQLGDGRFADTVRPLSATILPTSAVGTTADVLTALIAVGVPARDAICQAASDWLVAHQQPEGGWGELPADDADYLPGEGPVCVADTAVAVHSLVAAGLAGREAVGSGVDWLLDTASDTDLPQRCAALLAVCRWAADQHREARPMRQPPPTPLRVARLADIPA